MKMVKKERIVKCGVCLETKEIHSRTHKAVARIFLTVPDIFRAILLDRIFFATEMSYGHYTHYKGNKE